MRWHNYVCVLPLFVLQTGSVHRHTDVLTLKSIMKKALDGNEICDKFLHLAATLYEVAYVCVLPLFVLQTGSIHRHTDVFNSEINNEKALDGNEICDKFLHFGCYIV